MEIINAIIESIRQFSIKDIIILLLLIYVLKKFIYWIVNIFKRIKFVCIKRIIEKCKSTGFYKKALNIRPCVYIYYSFVLLVIAITIVISVVISPVWFIFTGIFSLFLIGGLALIDN